MEPMAWPLGSIRRLLSLTQLGKATWNYIGSESFLNELGFNINSPHSHQSAGEPGLPIWSCLSCQVGWVLRPSARDIPIGRTGHLLRVDGYSDKDQGKKPVPLRLRCPLE